MRPRPCPTPTIVLYNHTQACPAVLPVWGPPYPSGDVKPLCECNENGKAVHLGTGRALPWGHALSDKECSPPPSPPPPCKQGSADGEDCPPPSPPPPKQTRPSPPPPPPSPPPPKQTRPSPPPPPPCACSVCPPDDVYAICADTTSSINFDCSNRACERCGDDTFGVGEVRAQAQPQPQPYPYPRPRPQPPQP